MSGGIILRDDAAWIVAGWVARNVAEYLGCFLTEPECGGVRDRMEAVDLYPGSLADFADASADDIHRLYEAVNKGFAAAETEGMREWNQPELFKCFIERFRELLETIARDPRLKS